MKIKLKEPVILEAVQWTGENADEVMEFLYNLNPLLNNELNHITFDDEDEKRIR